MPRTYLCSQRLINLTYSSLLLLALVFTLLDSPAAAVQARSSSESPSGQTGSTTSTQGRQEMPLLEAGKLIKQELDGGQAHSYRIRLNAGECMHVTVEQRGIDVVVALRNSDGSQLTEMDGRGMVGEEEVSWEATSSGVYVLEVRAKGQEIPNGRYEVRLEKAATSERERGRITAERSFMEGRRAAEEGSGASLERGVRAYEAAAARWRDLGEEKWEGRALNSLGETYRSMGEFEKARELFEQALTIGRRIKDRPGEGWALNNLGFVHNDLSQYEKARQSLEVSLAIMREIKDKKGEGYALGNLGITHGYLGQYEKSRDYMEQTLAISREVKDRQAEALALNNLGEIYRDMGQYDKARDYIEQTLAISREGKDRGSEALGLGSLGEIYRDMGQYDKARQYLEQGLPISREIKDRAGEGFILGELGDVYRLLGSKPKSLEFYHQSLSIARATGERRQEANILANTARLERDSGHLGEARWRIEAAINIIESLRVGIISQESRATYFASVRDYYEFYTDLLMRLHEERPEEGFNAAALQVSERARARSLLELLVEARADIRQGIDPQLLGRERILQQRLNDADERRRQLLGGEHTEQQAAMAARELEGLTAEYQRVQAEIRRVSPGYAALTQPQPLSLKEIQAEVLDPETLLLEYSLGEERSFLWVVTQVSVASYELPKRSEIESAARRFYELLTARNERSLPASNQTEAQKAARRAAKNRQRFAEADDKLPGVAARLSQLVLSPVAPLLGTKRLLIVSDGALQYVPFAALPDPTSAVKRGIAGQPLVVNHEIVSLPSASTLAVLRRELRGRKPAAGVVAVLADPVFSKDDVRVDEALSRRRPDGTEAAKNAQTASAKAPASDLVDDVVRAITEVGVTRDGQGIPRLPSTRREANSILAAAPAAGGMKALDFEATRATVTSGKLAGYRIVHFATHGLLNSEHPELSGLVLSLVDESGRSQDGFLRLHEVYNLRLPAELVVLSACQTGLGKEIKGEGLVGLTRGFMYAGAKGVTASLWKVDDAATRELMTLFYRGMLKEGLRPAAALRGAQVEMWKQKRWQAPYYWAAFVLQGEWK